MNVDWGRFQLQLPTNSEFRDYNGMITPTSELGGTHIISSLEF